MPYSISTADIAARINGYQLTTTSTPSIATVEEVIQEVSSYVQMLVASKGVEVVGGSSQETYLRGIVIRLVCAQVEVMRSRNASEYSTTMETKAMAELNAILDRAANLANADKGQADKPAVGGIVPGRATCSTIDRWIAGGKL